MAASTHSAPLIKRVRNLRENKFPYKSLNEPQLVGSDEVFIAGVAQRRRRVVLTAHACKVATCTMCPLPDEGVDWGTPVTTENWLRQLKAALPAGDQVDILTVFHNGNFFSDQEVPAERRQAIYQWLRTTTVKMLVVESLPQFVTPERLAHAAEHLGPGIRVETAIGLQSTDDFLRETVLASTCTNAGFRRALQALGERGWGAQIFLMHQMPFLTVDESSAALADSVETLAREYGILEVICCALFITPATVAHDLYTRGDLKLPSLWQLADTLESIRQRVPASRARVAMSCLNPTFSVARTQSCPDCRSRLLDWVTAFNFQREGAMPERCSCGGPRVDFSKAYRRDEVQGRMGAYLGAVRA